MCILASVYKKAFYNSFHIWLSGDLNDIIPKMKKDLLKQVEKDLDMKIEDGEFSYYILCWGVFQTI